jgi:hypothetical protein
MNKSPDSMTLDELSAWVTRRGMALVPIAELERLIGAIAADMVAQAEAHNEFEANMNLLRASVGPPPFLLGCVKRGVAGRLLTASLRFWSGLRLRWRGGRLNTPGRNERGR